MRTDRPMNYAIIGYIHRGRRTLMHIVRNHSNQLKFLQHDLSTVR